MENENILTLFSLVFLTGFFLILPVYATSSFKLATPDEFGPNELISGALTIPQGIYSQTDKVKLSIGSIVKEKALKDLLSAEDYYESSPYYSALGSLVPDYSGTDFIVGIPFQKGSAIPEDASLSFKISPLNPANPPSEPSIDIGADDIIDWVNPGTPGANYLERVDVQGQYINAQNPEEERIITNCEKLFTTKTMEIRLKAFVETTESNKPYVTVYYQDGQDLIPFYDSLCEGTVSSADFAWLTCNLTLEESGIRNVFSSDYYYFCLSSGISTNKIKTNHESDYKKGYSCSQEECTKSDYDYLIYIESLSHDSSLKTEQELSVSNQEQDEPSFLSKAAEYIQNCVYTTYNGKEYCIIPIHVITDGNNELKIYDLNFEEQTSIGTVRTITRFVTNLKEESNTIELLSDTSINLQKFSLYAPSALNTYKLRAEFKSYSDEKNILVIPKPIANLSASSILLAPGEQTIFSAEGSTSPDDSALTYNFTFSDNTSYATQAVTKSFAKSGKYTVTLIVKDAKGRYSTPKTEEITVSTLISRAPKKFQEIKYSFDNAYKYYQAAPQEMKEVYTDLGLDTLIEGSKVTLDDYEAKLNTSQQLPNIDEQLASISEKTPRILSVQDSLTIKPYLTYNDISSVYPAEQEESKIAIQGVNEKIEKEFKAKIVKLTYINAAQESFVLIKKTFRTQVPLEGVFIKEILPSSMTASQLTFIKETPEIIDSRTLNYGFDSFTDEISFVYKLNSDNLLLIPNIITILTPKDFNIKMVAFNCPNGECNPGEDYLSCPEDCICGNNKCEKDKGETFTNCPDDCSNFPWTSFIITIAVILLIGSLIVVSKLKPGYLTSIKPVRKLMSLLSINPKIPFSSLAQLNKLIIYIKDTRAKGISEREIRNALLKKGWSEKQINFAFMRTK